MKNDEIAKKILYATYQKASKKNIAIVIEVLKSESTNKETDICDALGITRRWNRAEIRGVLAELNK
ncbi:MAG: hypothetical protein AAF717_00235 [Bacteroidota bacterium]